MASGCNTCGPAGCGSAELPAGHSPTYTIALAGNPNTGKSTVFNALTGLRQHTGNWPGKTVVRAEGLFVHRGVRFKLVDLPGTYSLSADSDDEQVARDFIWLGHPDVTVAVVDSTSLERNLNLVLQILEVTGSVVLCLNLQDEARRKGIHIDADALSRELGVPVIPTTARSGRGLPELKDAILETSQADPAPGRAVVTYSDPIESAVQELAAQLEKTWPELSNPRWVAQRLLHGDPSMIDAVRTGTLTEPPDHEPIQIGLASAKSG